jgi:hypothetical protein
MGWRPSFVLVAAYTVSREEKRAALDGVDESDLWLMVRTLIHGSSLDSSDHHPHQPHRTSPAIIHPLLGNMSSRAHL